MMNTLRKAVASSPLLTTTTRFASVSRPSLKLQSTLMTPLRNINLATRNAFAKRFMSSDTTATTAKKTWWTSAEFWGGAGAMAGWGMTGAAIWDATNAGPELISLNMTSVMLVYSSLFARWAWVVQPRNVALCACHVSNVFAQSNQMRRAVEHKIELGEQEEVNAMGMKAGAFAVGTGALIAGGPALQAAVVGANLGPVSAVAGAAAGPFTVHFWAPMSKWLISGASFLDLDRPTDKVSITQYTALTLTGFFFSRYAMLVNPINYMLCSVNIALFSSSAWHLGRKIKADYIDDQTTTTTEASPVDVTTTNSTEEEASN